MSDKHVSRDRVIPVAVRAAVAKPACGTPVLKGAGRKVPLEKWNQELGRALRREYGRR